MFLYLHRERVNTKMVKKGHKPSMKPLRPSMKEKKRYIVFRIISEGKINIDELAETIAKSCLAFLGLLYYGKAGVMLLKNQTNNGYAIVRVNNKYVTHVKTALMLITEVSGTQVACDVIGVSGILKKAREKFIPKHTQNIQDKNNQNNEQ